MGSGKYTNKMYFGGSAANIRHLDNENLDIMLLPAGEEVTVYGGQANVEVPAATGPDVEFVEITNGDAIWASADVSAAGANTVVEMTPDATQTGGTTYPFDIPSSTSDRIFAIRLNGNVGITGSFSAQMHMSNIKKS
jgi:hypothetical protein